MQGTLVGSRQVSTAPHCSHLRQSIAPPPRALRKTRPKSSINAISQLNMMSEDSAPALTAEQVQQYQQDGFLAVPDFASREQTAAMISRANQLVEQFDPASISIFSTRDDNKAHATDPYFLASASGIHFFFEEKAFDEAGHLRQAKAQSINKIGHAMHDIDPVFRAFSRSPKISAILKSLGYRRPLPVQSMYIFKDSAFLYTEPPSVTGLWLALEDANKTNGCLWALKGVHKQGLKRRFVMGTDGNWKVLFPGLKRTGHIGQLNCPGSRCMMTAVMSSAAQRITNHKQQEQQQQQQQQEQHEHKLFDRNSRYG
eukprot:jgi/Chrzof1/2966/Cz12g06100.t1